MKALVFGGTGTVGSEVVRAFAAADVQTLFTFHRSKEKAEALAKETKQEARAIDLREPAAIRALVESLETAGQGPEVFVHCAAVTRPALFGGVSDADWDEVTAVNARSAFVAVQALSAGMSQRKRGDIVLLGALDRAQSIPVPVHFAATQGMISAMTMALAKELGPSGIRVNQIALGVLAEGGVSRDLNAKLVADYRNFSALQRTGTAREVAGVIAWLALENTYMSGKVLPVNGGI